jgi:rare lipoprotein A
MAVAVFMDSTLTVQAYAPLSRPAATLPPAAPSPGLKSRAGAAAVRSIPAEALKGLASWYGGVFDGHDTASGERFDMRAMTAAHKTLPFGTLLRVINLRTRKSIVVRVNDRGVLPAHRVIDLSYAAAEKLQILKSGMAPVKLEVIALGGRFPETEMTNPGTAGH